MKRRTPPDVEFAEKWNAAATIDECCMVFTLPRLTAIRFASKLRRQGMALKKYGDANLFVVCPVCSITFKTSPSTVKSPAGRCCSLKCSIIRRRGKPLKHGDSYTRLHATWCHMKTRCNCETSPAYKYYGGRGIRVCDEWANSFVAFRDWAQANGYEDGLEIDRRDTNGNYEPDNCRWATRTQQMRNTRKRSNAKTSQYKGVSFHRGGKDKKWKVQVCVPGKPVHRGLFATELEAAREYDRIVRIEFGEFAMTNFKEEDTCSVSEEKSGKRY